jgi:hypothetical protein
VLELLPYKELVVFFGFPNIFYFIEFYSTCYFEFLNSILTKNFEIDSSFFRIFYFKMFQFFENCKFDGPVFGKPVPTGFAHFHKNQPVFVETTIHGHMFVSHTHTHTHTEGERERLYYNTFFCRYANIA